MPGPQTAYFSSCSHDDAAAAVAEAIALPAGIYNVVDDEPVTHEEYFDSLARTLRVSAPRFPPAWLTAITGSFGEIDKMTKKENEQKHVNDISTDPVKPAPFPEDILVTMLFSQLCAKAVGPQYRRDAVASGVDVFRVQ